jgi:hypothetical protein
VEEDEKERMKRRRGEGEEEKEERRRRRGEGEEEKEKEKRREGEYTCKCHIDLQNLWDQCHHHESHNI